MSFVRLIFILLGSFALLVCSYSSLKAQGIKETSEVEERIRQFFMNEDTDKLQGLLTEESRIFLSLESVKSVKGFFSPGQTLLIFREFFAANEPLNLKLESRADDDPSSLFFIQVLLTFKDRNSKIGTINLHFTFMRENGFWKLKEAKEAG
ncbi:MAG: hypothetical protein AB1756_06900 [Acidobacteriota bacterium]